MAYNGSEGVGTEFSVTYTTDQCLDLNLSNTGCHFRVVHFYSNSLFQGHQR